VEPVEYAYDGEGNLVFRGRLPAGEVLRYTPRALPAEGWMWSPHTRPDPGPGRWSTAEGPGPDAGDQPPGPDVIVRAERPGP
jgi:hypothetical protein